MENNFHFLTFLAFFNHISAIFHIVDVNKPCYQVVQPKNEITVTFWHTWEQSVLFLYENRAPSSWKPLVRPRNLSPQPLRTKFGFSLQWFTLRLKSLNRIRWKPRVRSMETVDPIDAYSSKSDILSLILNFKIVAIFIAVFYHTLYLRIVTKLSLNVVQIYGN